MKARLIALALLLLPAAVRADISAPVTFSGPDGATTFTWSGTANFAFNANDLTHRTIQGVGAFAEAPPPAPSPTTIYQGPSSMAGQTGTLTLAFQPDAAPPLPPSTVDIAAPETLAVFYQGQQYTWTGTLKLAYNAANPAQRAVSGVGTWKGSGAAPVPPPGPPPGPGPQPPPTPHAGWPADWQDVGGTGIPFVLQADGTYLCPLAPPSSIAVNGSAFDIVLRLVPHPQPAPGAPQ